MVQASWKWPIVPVHATFGLRRWRVPDTPNEVSIQAVLDFLNEPKKFPGSVHPFAHPDLWGAFIAVGAV
jgi:hypothetical protein